MKLNGAGIALEPGAKSYELGRGMSLKPDAAKERERLEATAQELVGRTFFRMMISEMRRTVPQDGMFSGGRGGEVFQEMMDQTFSEAMARREKMGLAGVLAGQVARRAGLAQTTETKGTGHEWEA